MAAVKTVNSRRNEGKFTQNFSIKHRGSTLSHLLSTAMLSTDTRQCCGGCWPIPHYKCMHAPCLLRVVLRLNAYTPTAMNFSISMCVYVLEKYQKSKSIHFWLSTGKAIYQELVYKYRKQILTLSSTSSPIITESSSCNNLLLI